ncbi:MAG: maleylacetoacetate isomerase [Kofleriaceae bacterium]
MNTITGLRLFNYWRSSASHRVRIALGLKGLSYEYVVVNILTKDQFADAYRAKNPMSQVPTLEVTEDEGAVYSIAQSLPIMEFLEERFPETRILPEDSYLRARCRGLAEIVNSGIQPLQNLTTTKRVAQMGGDDQAWVKAFVAEGMTALAYATMEVSGLFSVGDMPTIADCCLVPQLASARRFGLLDADGVWADHAPLPGLHEPGRASLDALLAIEKRCLELPAFVDAAPDRQPDAVK